MADELPLKPVEDLPLKPPPRLAPAWVPLVSTWLGLLSLILSLALPLLPGTSDPQSELTHLKRYSLADLALPWLMNLLQPAAIFLGIITLWQMRREPRPLDDSLLLQRLQAFVGITLAALGAAFIYIYVYYFGPSRPG